MKSGKPKTFSAAQEAFAAYEIWAKVFNKPTGRQIDVMDEFAEFLGDPRGGHRSFADQQIIINTNNPEVMDKVRKINGPNGYTVLKMMKAQDEDT
jgi:hypothetical protein